MVTCSGFSQSATEVSNSGAVSLTTGRDASVDINMAGKTRATDCTVALTVADFYNRTAAITKPNLFKVSEW